MNEKTEKTIAETSNVSITPLTFKTFDNTESQTVEKIGKSNVAIFYNKAVQLCELWIVSKKVLMAIFRLSKAYNKQACIGRLDIRLSPKDKRRLQDLKDKIATKYPNRPIEEVDAEQIPESELEQYGMIIINNGKDYIISSMDEKILILIFEALEENKGWRLIKGSIEMPLSYPEEDWRKVKDLLGKIQIQRTSATR
jgi:hypothetical protein